MLGWNWYSGPRGKKLSEQHVFILFCLDPLFIWTMFYLLYQGMLYAKLNCHWTSGSETEEYLKLQFESIMKAKHEGVIIHTSEKVS